MQVIEELSVGEDRLYGTPGIASSEKGPVLMKHFDDLPLTG